MKVTTPTGGWHVRRRWAPRELGSQTIWARFRDRSRKARRRASQLDDVPDPGCAVDLVDEVFGVLALVVVVVFLVFVGIPFLIALGELLFIVLLTVLGVVGRVLFRRPWTIDAVDPGGGHHTWAVVGWRASAAARRYVADRIAATDTVPTQDELAAAVMAV